MASFTKNYKVQPNQKQMYSMKAAFINLCQYFVNEEGADVVLEVDQFNEKKIVVDLIVNGVIFDTKVIGVLGGLKTL